jgi:hypothetical protein
MSEIAEKTIADYKLAHVELRQRIEGLTEKQLKWKPAPEKWSVKEVLAHLVDSAFVHSIRIRKLVAEADSGPVLLLYDQDAWVARARSNDGDIEDILGTLESVIRYNALFYERLSAEDWGKSGVLDSKTVTVFDLFQGFFRHIDIHLAQIDRTKAAYSAG